MKYELRDYQEDIVSRLRNAYRQGFSSPLLCSPCASGKTVMFAFMTESAVRMGKRVMIIVHRKELLLQSSRALLEIGVPHGIIAPGFSMTHDYVQVVSKDSLVRRLNRTQVPDLIILDEAHHSIKGSTWGKIIGHYPSAKLLGVTATPSRLDGRGLGVALGGFFDTLIPGPSVRNLIDMGFLSEPVVYAPAITPDLTGIRKNFGEYNRAQVGDAIDRPKITGCAVDHYKRICPGVPAIAFCVSVAHAEHVAEQFNAAGIPAASIDGKLDDTDRKQRIYDLGSGAINILCACEIISEGLDIPVVTTAILLRPTQSTGLFIQQTGRAMRIHPNKKRSYILDHAGNTFRHGYPDDDREWSLDGDDNGKTKNISDPKMYIQCENCFRVFKRTASCCPSCGWERTVQERELEQVDGELTEVSAEAKRQNRMRLKSEEGQAQSLKDFEEIARQRGYKPGWATIRWRLRMQRSRGVHA